MDETIMILDALFVVALAGLAAASVFSRDLFLSVVLFMVFGLVMALVWARLLAPDIALTEIALGAGLTGSMLLFAVSSLKRGERDKWRRRDDVG